MSARPLSSFLPAEQRAITALVEQAKRRARANPPMPAGSPGRAGHDATTPAGQGSGQAGFVERARHTFTDTLTGSREPSYWGPRLDAPMRLVPRHRRRPRLRLDARVGRAVSSHLAGAIAVARALAWLPVANLVGVRFHERRELHAELVARLSLARTPANADPALAYLVGAMRRVAAASFANRRGEPYYVRKAALLELRGCLVVYDQPHPSTDHVDAIALSA